MAVTKKQKKFIHSRSHSNHEKLFMKILVSKKEGFELSVLSLAHFRPRTYGSYAKHAWFET